MLFYHHNGCSYTFYTHIEKETVSRRQTLFLSLKLKTIASNIKEKGALHDGKNLHARPLFEY